MIRIMLRELINKENEFQIIFTEISGGGWLNDLVEIIKLKLQPSKIGKKNKSVSWDDIEAEILIYKDNINAKFEIDDIGNISLVHKETSEEVKQKLRDWAMIVAKEVEKQREKEKKLIEVSKKVLQDFNRAFFDDTFKVFNPKKINELEYNFGFDVWKVFVHVPDEQFGGQSPFSICFRDDTMEPFMFHDGGAEGRTPDLEILKKSGKYVIGEEWKREKGE
ncbi:hypothetical protein [Myroides odoratus]|nr:hypothetical protein [Myroides odoratus]